MRGMPNLFWSSIVKLSEKDFVDVSEKQWQELILVKDSADDVPPPTVLPS